MRYILSFCLLYCVFLNAAAVDISETDFVARLINFVIFVVIVWMLIAKKAKMFFSERSRSISDQLSEVQVKLKNAKNQKEQTLRRLQEARESAAEILANAKKESYLVAQKIEEQSGHDIEIMMKNTELLMEFEQRRMEKAVIDEVLDQIFAESKISASEYGNIIEKKVV